MELWIHLESIPLELPGLRDSKFMEAWGPRLGAMQMDSSLSPGSVASGAFWANQRVVSAAADTEELPRVLD